MNKYDPQYIDEEEQAIIEPIKTMDVNKLKKPSINEQKKVGLGPNIGHLGVGSGFRY